jgi:hypothetical protein
MPHAYPTEQEIRAALIERVTAYCHTADITPRILFKRAINDPNFFKKLEKGGNFTLRTYQRVHHWLDRHPRKGTKKRRTMNGHGGNQ